MREGEDTPEGKVNVNPSGPAHTFLTHNLCFLRSIVTPPP